MRSQYRSWMSRLAAVLLMSLTTACAFTPASLELKPQVTVPPISIGSNTSLLFKFVDERDDVTIGHRSVATVGAKISSDELPRVLEAQLRSILAAKGYRFTTDAAASDAEVVYRLRSFKFDIETGFFTGGRNAAAALAVDARRKALSYNNVYRFNSEERIIFIPGESEINQQMNGALNQILDKAASDTALDSFLTTR